MDPLSVRGCMRLLARSLMVVVGVAVLLVYSAVAVGGLVVLQWMFANPPGATALLVGFVVAVLLAGYSGYRLGALRLVASLDAAELLPEHAPEVHRRFRRLCADARVDPPALLVADLGAPNALSVGGPRRGAVVVDERLFEFLTIDELEGILAHELAHIERRDTFYNTLALTAARTLVGFVAVLLFPVVVLLLGIDRAAGWIAGRPGRTRVGLAGYFQWGVTLVLGVLLFAFTLAFLAYSRKQEFAADRRAAELTGKPAALARALAKLHRATSPREGLLSLLYTHDDRRGDERWLSTHPPVQDRIDRLLEPVEVAPGQHVMRLQPR